MNRYHVEVMRRVIGQGSWERVCVEVPAHDPIEARFEATRREPDFDYEYADVNLPTAKVVSRLPWFDELTEAEQASARMLRENELTVWTRSQFPRDVRFGTQIIRVLGPVEWFPPYDKHDVPTLWWQMLAEGDGLTGDAHKDTAIVLVSSLKYLDGTPVVTPWPAPMRPMPFLGYYPVSVFPRKAFVTQQTS